MKKLCRIVSGALAALFAAALLAGCSEEGASGSSDAPSAAPTGGYVEEDVSPDHNYNVGLFAVDGVLNAFTVENPATPLSQQPAHWYALGQDGHGQAGVAGLHTHKDHIEANEAIADENGDDDLREGQAALAQDAANHQAGHADHAASPDRRDGQPALPLLRADFKSGFVLHKYFLLLRSPG